MRRALRRTLALCLIGTTGACFHYVPTTAVPSRGARVRAELSRPQPVELRAITANNVVQVRGELVTSDPDRLVLSVFGLRAVGGFEYLSEGETVVLPQDAVGRLDERRISVPSTLLAAALLTTAGYLVQLGLGGALGGGESDPGGGVSR